jgi:acyl carrier protein
LDTRALRADLPAGLASALFSDLSGVRGERQPDVAAVGGDDELARIAGLPQPLRLDELTGMVRSATARVLGHASAAEIDTRAAFTALGFDSLIAVELRNHLMARTKLRIPAAAAFDYPTPEALARYLNERLFPEDGQDSVLTELDRLEQLLEAAGEGEIRSRATARLRVMIRRWAEEAGPADVASQLDSASTAEILSFIDRDLGRAR